jgi:hypothetical protein
MDKTMVQSGTVSVPVELAIGYPLEYNKEKVLVKKVALREITGYEEELLLSRRLDPTDKIIQVIASCVTDIWGIKPDGTATKIERTFADVVVAGLSPIDKIWLFLKLRSISLGPNFEFEYNCENCGTKNLYKINLDEIERTVPGKVQFEYQLTLPSGKVAVCRLPVGETSVNLMKLSVQDVNYASKSILLRLVSLDGKPADLNAVRALSMRDRNYLREKFNEYEGSLDTTKILKCGACGSEVRVDIDFAQPSFFFPKMT